MPATLAKRLSAEAFVADSPDGRGRLAPFPLAGRAGGRVSASGSDETVVFHTKRHRAPNHAALEPHFGHPRSPLPRRGRNHWGSLTCCKLLSHFIKVALHNCLMVLRAPVFEYRERFVEGCRRLLKPCRPTFAFT